jgi:hypothetical protein
MIGRVIDQFRLNYSHSGMHWNENVLTIAARRYAETDFIRSKAA